MNILGVVTARGGSKRIPNKNIADLGGHPLIHYCLKAAMSCRKITTLVVSTDDDKIASVVSDMGCDILRRPTELARDDSKSVDVIKHAILATEQNSGIFDYVFTIQPTYPFVSKDNFDMVIDKFNIQTPFDSVITVYEAPYHFHPFNARKLEPDGTISFMFPEEKHKYHNSQLAPKVYYFGNLIATKRKSLFSKNSLFGDKSIPVPVSEIESFDIDDKHDLKKAEFFLKNRWVEYGAQ